ncbi:MAG: HTH domain-containing protein [Tractidigestivibacter sp.]|uniref:HTH domain-containing protein n=1 Tax=Tractidigestivibacter sp. TaxID=2847320 RepID=UPI003D912BE7
MKGAELAVYIRDHQGVTPETLSSYLGVSERTIRKYVRRLNGFLGSIAHISLKRGGYHLACENWSEFSRVWMPTEMTGGQLSSASLIAGRGCQA